MFGAFECIASQCKCLFLMWLFLSHRLFKLFMSVVAIMNSIALCFYEPAPNNDTKQVNDIIVCDCMYDMVFPGHQCLSMSMIGFVVWYHFLIMLTSALQSLPHVVHVHECTVQLKWHLSLSFFLLLYMYLF